MRPVMGFPHISPLCDTSVKGKSERSDFNQIEDFQFLSVLKATSTIKP